MTMYDDSSERTSRAGTSATCVIPQASYPVRFSGLHQTMHQYESTLTMASPSHPQ